MVTLSRADWEKCRVWAKFILVDWIRSGLNPFVHILNINTNGPGPINLKLLIGPTNLIREESLMDYC